MHATVCQSCRLDSVMQPYSASPPPPTPQPCHTAGSRGVKITADQLMSEASSSKYDLIALPGGMPGAERLRDSEDLNKLVSEQQQYLSSSSQGACMQQSAQHQQCS